jgi:hypothetical protein
MTAAALQGRTDRETAQYAADHGKSAAQAMGYRCMGRYLHAHALEDMELLGIREIPDPRPQMWPVTGGTDEDRMARIDAWAKRHGITAGTDEASGHYKAVLAFGPVRVEVYTVPDRVMADRIDAVNRQLAALHSAVAGRDAA